MIYELRVDEVQPGRLPEFHERLSQHVMRFFAKHEIEALGFWMEVVGTSNRVTALLRFEDLADRERKWNNLLADPEYLEIRARTDANGPLVTRVSNLILQPTPYSPLS